MIVTLLLAGSFLTAAAPDPKEANRERAAELVLQLGHPSFKVREKASEELVRLGSASLEPLRKGVNHADAEISDRCKSLIPRALDCHLQEQIALFLDKPDAPISIDLPGINRWIKIAGKGKDSRELYSLLIKEQRKILIEMEQNPDKVGQQFHAFCLDVYNRARIGVNPQKEAVSYSEVALFLFLGGDANARKQNATASISYIHANAFISSSHLAGMLSGATASDASKKIFLSWLEQERYPILVRRGYQMAAAANLKEAIPIAIRVANDKTLLPTARSYALLGAVKLFGPDDIKLLEGLMDDKTVVGRIAVNGEATTTEIRDLALGISIMATGQKPVDYGYDRLRENFVAISYSYYAITDKKREAAVKKWKEWQAQKGK